MQGLILVAGLAAFKSRRHPREISNLFLLPGSEVSAAGADLQIFFQSGDLDRAITAVGVEVRGLIGNGVLAAQFVFDGGE